MNSGGKLARSAFAGEIKGSSDLTQIDIARVEVMRGPQGTLYGRNANGGVINFVTEAPTGAFGGQALASYASYASYDETRLQGVVNIPDSDRVRARLVLDRWNRDDGFVENATPGARTSTRAIPCRRGCG